MSPDGPGQDGGARRTPGLWAAGSLLAGYAALLFAMAVVTGHTGDFVRMRAGTSTLLLLLIGVLLSLPDGGIWLRDAVRAEASPGVGVPPRPRANRLVTWRDLRQRTARTLLLTVPVAVGDAVLAGAWTGARLVFRRTMRSEGTPLPPPGGGDADTRVL